MYQQRQPSQQRAILKALSATAVVGLQFYFAISLFRGLYYLAAWELVLSMVAIGVNWSCRFNEKLDNIALMFCLGLFAAFFTVLFYSSTHISIFVWTLVLPVICYLLLGRRRGLMVTASFMALIAGAFIWRLQQTGDSSFVSLGPSLNIGLSTGLVWALSHIQERAREVSEQQLHRRATIDPLTGLLNRSQLEDVFNRELSRSRRNKQPICLAIFDLDHFESINQQHGRKAGDHALKVFSGLITASIRRSDFAFSLGGEQFGIILTGANLVRATKIAEQLRLMLSSQVIAWADSDIRVTMSAGVAQFGCDTGSLERLCDAADKCLLQAKSSGRNKVVNADSIHFDERQCATI